MKTAVLGVVVDNACLHGRQAAPDDRFEPHPPSTQSNTLCFDDSSLARVSSTHQTGSRSSKMSARPRSCRRNTASSSIDTQDQGASHAPLIQRSHTVTAVRPNLPIYLGPFLTIAVATLSENPDRPSLNSPNSETQSIFTPKPHLPNRSATTKFLRSLYFSQYHTGARTVSRRPSDTFVERTVSSHDTDVWAFTFLRFAI
jgi:hypothetical protein